MKKFFLSVIANIIVVSAFSQLSVYARTNDGNLVPDINLYATKKLSNKFSLTGFLLVEQKWAEALVGIAYSPKKWISIGLSTGIEHNPAAYRFAGSLWIGGDSSATSFLGLWEKGDGKENYWYRVNLYQKLSDQFTIGAVAWRFHGVGPTARYTPKKSDLTFWVMPAYDFEVKQTRAILGISIKLQ